MRVALVLVALAACERSSPLQRLEPFAGDWRCAITHVSAGGERVVQRVTIARDASRYAIRFAPDPRSPSRDAVTSVAYWSYEGERFTSEANVGAGDTAVVERYTSPGPDGGRLVWTGEARSAITAALRVTWTRTSSGLDLGVEAFAEHAWKPLSIGTCSRDREQPIAQAAHAAPAAPQLPPDVPGAPRSPFVTGASDRFAYGAVLATDDERRRANEAAERAQAEITEAVSHDKPEAIDRIRNAYAERDRALDDIFGADRAGVLRGIRILDGVEVSDDRDAD